MKDQNLENAPQWYQVCCSNQSTVELGQRICFANPQVAGPNMQSKSSIKGTTSRCIIYYIDIANGCLRKQTF